MVKRCWRTASAHTTLGSRTAQETLQLRLWKETAFLVDNTTWKEAGPSYFGHNGTQSAIDHLWIPQGLRCKLILGTICSADGRKLQLIPSAQPRDHMPMMAVIEIEGGLVAAFSDKRAVRWDFTALAAALQKGEGRVPFWRSCREGWWRRRGGEN